MKSMLPQKSPVSPLVYSTGRLPLLPSVPTYLTITIIFPSSFFFNFPSFAPKRPQELKPLIFCAHTRARPVSHITTCQLIIHGGSSLFVCECVCVCN